MTNNIHKIFSLFLIIVTSQLIISCSEGDRGFVPLPETPEPEVVEDLYITGSAVKGPLVNASIGLYKFELNQGPIAEYNNALRAWFELLASNEVTVNDNSTFSLGSLSNQQVMR